MKRSKIKNILVIYKNSTYEKYALREGRYRLSAKILKQDLHTLKKLKKAHEAHLKTLSEVKKILKEKKVNFKIGSRRKIETVKGFDLIITVGGDGTFLRTSHHVSSELMLGVNSSPRASVGALLSTTLENFQEKLEQILLGNYKVKELTRLSIWLNEKKLPSPALNDILFANRCPAGTSRYLLKIDHQKEEQKSSGVWITTAAGSTAAIKAAGGTVLPHISKKIQFLVREPYQGSRKYRLIKGVLSPASKIELINHMMNAALYVDGMQSIYPLQFGNHITIKASPLPLRVVI